MKKARAGRADDVDQHISGPGLIPAAGYLTSPIEVSKAQVSGKHHLSAFLTYPMPLSCVSFHAAAYVLVLAFNLASAEGVLRLLFP